MLVVCAVPSVTVGQRDRPVPDRLAVGLRPVDERDPVRRRGSVEAPGLPLRRPRHQSARARRQRSGCDDVVSGDCSVQKGRGDRLLVFGLSLNEIPPLLVHVFS